MAMAALTKEVLTANDIISHDDLREFLPIIVMVDAFSTLVALSVGKVTHL